MDKQQDRPDSLVLASYLDGRLDEDERKRVERWLADSPDGVDLLLSAREALSTPSLLPPESLVRRAGALTDPAGADQAFLPMGRFWQIFYWPSTAALVLISCLVGFQLAQSAMTEAGLIEPVAIEVSATAESVFDLGGADGSPL